MEFLKKNKKKILVLSIMVILLVATGVLNWALSTDAIGSTSTTTSTEPSTQTFFNAYRSDRTALRQEELLELEAIIASSDTSETAKQAAEEMKLELVERMDKALYIEGLIKGQGFEDAIVTLGGTTANVVVVANELAPNDVAKIVDLVIGETSYNEKEVNVIPYS